MQGSLSSFGLDLDVLASNVGSTNQNPVLGPVFTVDDPTTNLPLLAGIIELNSNFGHDVARTKNFSVVGEPFQSINSAPVIPSVGAAHVYFNDIFITTLQNVNPTEGDAFGAYVAMEEIGGDAIIAVSAHLKNGGAGVVYLYKLGSGSIPVHVFSRSGAVEYGQDVDMDNGKLIIKYDGGAEVYDVLQKGFPLVADFTHDEPVDDPPMFFFSQTCEISGNLVALGVPGSSFTGRIFVYNLLSPNTPIQILEDPTLSVVMPEAESWPTSIALSGGRLVVGTITHSVDAFYQGEANLFYVPGDVNRDGFTNLLDVGPFVDVLSSGEYLLEADINLDGIVDLLDVNPFVDLIQ